MGGSVRWPFLQPLNPSAPWELRPQSPALASCATKPQQRLRSLVTMFYPSIFVGKWQRILRNKTLQEFGGAAPKCSSPQVQKVEGAAPKVHKVWRLQPPKVQGSGVRSAAPRDARGLGAAAS